MKRPFHVLAVAGTAAHHVFETVAGVGLIFQPYLGLRGAGAFWGTVLPGSALAAARGAERWDRPLGFAAGTALGMDVLHYAVWPSELRRGLPTLTEAESLRGRALAAYNALLWVWGAIALLALARETPRHARPWAGIGAVATVIGGYSGPASVERHFKWMAEQARVNPAWWNRAVAGEQKGR